MRCRKKIWKNPTLEAIRDKKLLLDEPSQYKGRWHEFFGNRNPIYVELGTGKGRFVTENAVQNPDINYIGVEFMEDILAYAGRKALDKNVSNLVLLHENVSDLLYFFERGELGRLYLNFSDPWPKNRHAKKRLTHKNFLDLYKQVLLPGQEIHFKTDNEPLFEFSLNSLADNGFRLKNMTLDLHHTAFAEHNIMTEYEEKFSSMGMKIFRLEAVVGGWGDGGII